MAKQDDSVNRIPGRSIADIMPRGAAGRCHRQRSRFIGWPEARSMKWRRVQAGQAKDSKLRPSSRRPSSLRSSRLRSSGLGCLSRCVCTFMPVWGHRKTMKSAIDAE